MPADPVPLPLARRFEAVVLDWDGTAVVDRRADASEVGRLIEALCAAAVDVAIVSCTHVDDVDGQLRARPKGPGRLHLLLNHGSEVFRVDDRGVELVYRRTATPGEEAALSAAAEVTVRRLAEHHGLEARIVSGGLDRRKIDIISERAWQEPGKAQIADPLAAVQPRLLRFGAALPEVVETAKGAARDAGLEDPRVTTDAKHIEIGLTDKSDSGRWILHDLWRRGIGSGLVLIAGDDPGRLGGLPGSDPPMLVREATRPTTVSFGDAPQGVPAGVLQLGGGPATLVRILRDQLSRREQREPPELDSGIAWTLIVNGFDPLLERVRETLLALADGKVGTAGTATFDRAGRPRVLANGIYEGQRADARLLPCPQWNVVGTQAAAPLELRRTLDMRTGILREELETATESVTVTMFSSLARPGTVALRARSPSTRSGLSSLRAPDLANPVEAGQSEGARWMTIATSEDGGVAAAAVEHRLDADGSSTLDRVAVYVPTTAAPPDHAASVDAVRPAERAGFDNLLLEHRAAWARRWEDADVVIEGDTDLQRDVRFALFHLMSSVGDVGEAAVGARGLSGPAYRGHVFWDADVFVLPFLAATHAESARAMLEYRLRRLPAAEARARAEGHTGARFPWESASEGIEATPSLARDPSGELVAIRTGELEEHVVADIAWAAACYVDWTGDDAFAATGASRLLAATARYWASRVRFDRNGKAHIDGVIGPDEYHEEVDDNAFTNVMARWNLRHAASAVSHSSEVAEAERRRWLQIADALVDGYDEATGIYEQFAGFRDLEPLVIADIAPSRPIAAGVLLGRDRVSQAQVVKQADVLMLHHMVPDEVVPRSLAANLAYYEPRTAHGSSLSPGIHASLLARAGRLDEALALLRLASRIDLDDLSESTAGGLHLAAMGSVWQALVMGFAGLQPRGDVLEIDPRLPSTWSALEVRVTFRGSRLRIRIESSVVIVVASPPARVKGPDMREAVVASESGARLARAVSGRESQA